MHALNQRLVVSHDQLQILVKFRLDVIRSIGRLGVVHIEEVQKSRDPAVTAEHVVATA